MMRPRPPFVVSRLLPVPMLLFLIQLLLASNPVKADSNSNGNVGDPSDMSSSVSAATSTSAKTTVFPTVLPPPKRTFTNPLMKETFHVLAECVDTDNEYTLLKVVAPANITSVPMHHHNNYDEHIQVLDGIFYTTIDGVNRSYHAGESFTFPQQVPHLWWTAPDETASILLKMEPCHDGFHESVEIYSNVPDDWIDVNNPDIVKDLWTTAVLYDIGGTSFDSGAVWYQSILLWIFKQMAKTSKGQRLKEELRSKYLYVTTGPETTTNDDYNNNNGAIDHDDDDATDTNHQEL